MEKAKNWRVTGIAYGLEHATRPATIGLVLSSSPLALLGWIGEKYLEWADTPIPVETILRQTSLYWFTSSLPRCIYPYRSLLLGEGDGPSSTTKPLGYSAFKDIRIMPKAWSKYFPNMKFRKDHSKVSKDRIIGESTVLGLLTKIANRVGISPHWSSPRHFLKMSKSF